MVDAVAVHEPSLEELIERFDLATVAAFAAMRLPPIADEADGEHRAQPASAVATTKPDAKP